MDQLMSTLHQMTTQLLGFVSPYVVQSSKIFENYTGFALNDSMTIPLPPLPIMQYVKPLFVATHKHFIKGAKALDSTEFGRDWAGRIPRYINLREPYMQAAIIVAIAAPLFWNILARIMHLFISRRPMIVRYIACYALAVYILAFSLYRDLLFHEAMGHQKVYPIFTQHADLVNTAGIGFILLGQLFVLSSFIKLGITGTFLGDYCGILMKKRVESFPFNVLDNPMYVGSSMSFFGSALYNHSLAGVALSALIFIIYKIASIFEGAYTTSIYRAAAANKAKKNK